MKTHPTLQISIIQDGARVEAATNNAHSIAIGSHIHVRQVGHNFSRRSASIIGIPQPQLTFAVLAKAFQSMVIQNQTGVALSRRYRHNSAIGTQIDR
jgi:hypothetical protein